MDRKAMGRMDIVSCYILVVLLVRMGHMRQKHRHYIQLGSNISARGLQYHIEHLHHTN